MADNEEQAVIELTKETLKVIADVIRENGYITDECKKNGEPLLSKTMMNNAGSFLIERIQNDGEYGGSLSHKSSQGTDNKGRHVMAIYDDERYEIPSEFKDNVLNPFIDNSED